MAISIRGVTISKGNTSTQPLNIGETYTITVMVEDVSWDTIKNDFQDWAAVKALSSWNSVKNYI